MMRFSMEVENNEAKGDYINFLTLAYDPVVHFMSEACYMYIYITVIYVHDLDIQQGYWKYRL